MKSSSRFPSSTAIALLALVVVQLYSTDTCSHESFLHVEAFGIHPLSRCTMRTTNIINPTLPSFLHVEQSQARSHVAIREQLRQRQRHPPSCSCRHHPSMWPRLILSASSSPSDEMSPSADDDSDKDEKTNVEGSSNYSRGGSSA